MQTVLDKICWACRGSGETSSFSFGALGTFLIKKDCTICKGKGTVAKSCKLCNGLGINRNRRESPETCKRCNGSGKQT